MAAATATRTRREAREEPAAAKAADAAAQETRVDHPATAATPPPQTEPAPPAQDDAQDDDWEPPEDTVFVAHKDIHAAKRALMSELREIARKSAKGLGFKILKMEDLVDAVGPLLVKHGIVPSPVRVKTEEAGTYQTETGKAWRYARVRARYLLTHADSGTSVPAEAVGEGTDSGDKAAYKAQTGAYKYVLWTSFCLKISSELAAADPDNHPSEPARPAARRDARPAQAAQMRTPSGQSPPRNQAPRAGQGAGYATPFEQRKNALLAAKAVETLDLYRGKYTTDGVCSGAEITELDKVYEQRKALLTNPRPSEAISGVGGRL